MGSLDHFLNIQILIFPTTKRDFYRNDLGFIIQIINLKAKAKKNSLKS